MITGEGDRPCLCEEDVWGEVEESVSLLQMFHPLHHVSLSFGD